MFLEHIPHKLRVEVNLYIHESRYKKIKFFKNKSNSFISWICPFLKPCHFNEDQLIYAEGDEVECIYFLIEGGASMVLPSYQNTKYVNIGVGEYFGVIDIIGECLTR